MAVALGNAMNLNWNAQNSLLILAAAVVSALVVVALYWAKVLFIPIALAVYLTFLLSIPTNLLQRLGLRRTPAVLVVALLALVLIVGFGWIVVRQMDEFVTELPSYRDNLAEKARSLREFTQDGPLAQLDRIFQEIAAEVVPDNDPGDRQRTRPAEERPEEKKVVVMESRSEIWPWRLQGVVMAMIEPLAEALLTAVLVLFMLLKQEDLRNRLIRLLGPDRLTATTRAIDETDRRIARFLLTQFLVNSCFALAVALGLTLVGVKYALLWGFVAGLFRYVPYVGAWIGAFFPLALSVVIFPSWLPPLYILGLFISLEVVIGNFIEPIVFGHSIGVSEVALLISAGFWTFLWGPMGLLLSGPLTVCLVVASRHVPQLWFFDVLLGDAPPLPAATSYYQRLLAQDQDEAADIVQAYLKEHPAEEVYDGLFVPALSLMKRDRDRDELPPEREAFIVAATREIMESIVPAPESPPAHGAGHRARLLACPASDQEDMLALEMLRRLLDPSKWEVEIAPADALAVELIDLVTKERPALVCVGSLAPGGLNHSRYLCKRLRARFAGLKILVGRWGADVDPDQRAQTGADELTTSLLDTRRWLHNWRPALTHEKAAV